MPETSDVEFTWEKFQADVNKDLADVLGNFVSRITKFCRSKFGEAVPEAGEYGAAEEALIADIAQRVERYQTQMDAIEMRKATQELRAIWAAGNEYLQAQAPWTTFKTEPDKAAAQVRLALNLIPLYATLSAPFIPEAAEKMLTAMKVPSLGWPEDVPSALATLPAGHGFVVPEVLFAKISDDDRDAWADRFAGKRE